MDNDNKVEIELIKLNLNAFKDNVFEVSRKYNEMVSSKTQMDLLRIRLEKEFNYKGFYTLGDILGGTPSNGVNQILQSIGNMSDDAKALLHEYEAMESNYYELKLYFTKQRIDIKSCLLFTDKEIGAIGVNVPLLYDRYIDEFDRNIMQRADILGHDTIISLIDKEIEGIGYELKEYYENSTLLSVGSEMLRFDGRNNYLIDFIKDLAKYEYLQYLLELKHEYTQIPATVLPDRLKTGETILFLNKIGFFDLPFVKSLSPNKQGDLIHYLIGTKQSTTRKFIANLDKKYIDGGDNSTNPNRPEYIKVVESLEKTLKGK